MKNPILFISFFILPNIYFAQETPWGENNGAQSVPCVTNATTWFLGGNDITPLTANQGNTATPNQAVQQNNIGTCNDFDFILKAYNNKTMWIKPNTKVGISEAIPTAKFEVLETNPLNLETGGNYGLLITSFRGLTPAANDIKHNNWMYRVLSNQPNGSWEDYALHDGVSIGDRKSVV